MSEAAKNNNPPLFNRIMITFLRSPFHYLVSKSIMLISFTGRRTGKVYTTPVSYARQGDTVTCFTRGKWWKNLVGGAPVILRIKGQDMKGAAEVIADDREIIAAGLGAFFLQVPGDARFYNVKLDADRQAKTEQLAQAAQDIIMIRVHLANSSS